MIQIRHLTRRFGNLTAVDDLCLELNPGDIFGFIGPNGAGKTTTIRMLATLLEPSEGEAFIDGNSVIANSDEVRRLVGYMPDQFGVYEGLTVWEYLDFFAAAHNLGKKERKKGIDAVIELTDLEEKRDTFVSALSRGMRQRLCLAKTLVHDPKVLLLDEPAAGLDPRARIEIREVLRELGRMGKTIFISSHILTELADVCNKVGIIEQGNLLASGGIAEMLEQFAQGQGETAAEVVGSLQRRSMEFLVLRGLNEAERVLSHRLKGEDKMKVVRGDGDLYEGQVLVEFTGSLDDMADLVSLLVERGVKLCGATEKKGDLEDLFMRVTKGIVS